MELAAAHVKKVRPTNNIEADKSNNHKTTISLSLDSDTVEKVRVEAKKSNQSVNSKINAILQKYVNFYSMTELYRAHILPPSLYQFMVNEIDEGKFIDEFEKTAVYFIESLFVQLHISLTLANYVCYLQEYGINSGVLREISSYVDKDDGKTRIFIIHEYNLKYSRILSTVISRQLARLFQYHTSTKLFEKNFEIMIIENII